MYAQSNCEAQKQRDLDEAAASPQSPREGEGGLLRRFSTVSERRSKPTKATLWRDPEPYEVYQAIEKKDLIYLMTVRDRAFRVRVATKFLRYCDTRPTELLKYSYFCAGHKAQPHFCTR